MDRHCLSRDKQTLRVQPGWLLVSPSRPEECPCQQGKRAAITRPVGSPRSKSSPAQSIKEGWYKGMTWSLSCPKTLTHPSEIRPLLRFRQQEEGFHSIPYILHHLPAKFTATSCFLRRGEDDRVKILLDTPSFSTDSFVDTVFHHLPIGQSFSLNQIQLWLYL